MTRLHGYDICPDCDGKRCAKCHYRGVVRAKKRAKYGNKKKTTDEIKFDSQAEADYYTYLKLLQSAGVVESFELQPSFELVPATIAGSRKNQPVKYRGDFRVKYADGRETVEDVKGVETKEFIIKAKLYDHLAPAHGWPPLRIVKRVEGAWIDAEDIPKRGGGKRDGKAKAKEKTKPGATRGKKGGEG